MRSVRNLDSVLHICKIMFLYRYNKHNYYQTMMECGSDSIIRCENFLLRQVIWNLITGPDTPDDDDDDDDNNNNNNNNNSNNNN